MKKLMIAAATLLVASSLSAFAASEKEENVASSGAAILLLSASKCDLNKFDLDRVMKQVQATYDMTGVHPGDYKQGEWMRKIFFTINQTDYMQQIYDGEPTMLRAFCQGMAEKFPR
jgi:hypothetical protein